jgi:hypothetical protein
MIMTIERQIEAVLTAHETHWRLLAALLRALDTDEEAAWSLHRHVRDAMGQALLAGYEGREPTPRRPPAYAHHKAEQWVGMQLLRDIGPRGLIEVDWLRLARALTALAGPRIRQRARGEPPPQAVATHVRRLETEVADRAARREGHGDRPRPQRTTMPLNSKGIPVREHAAQAGTESSSFCAACRHSFTQPRWDRPAAAPELRWQKFR